MGVSPETNFISQENLFPPRSFAFLADGPAFWWGPRKSFFQPFVMASGSDSKSPSGRAAPQFGVDPRFRLNLQAAHDLSLPESENDYSRVRSRADAPA